MAVDTRRVTEGPANVLSEYVEEAGGTRLRVGGTRTRGSHRQVG